MLPTELPIFFDTPAGEVRPELSAARARAYFWDELGRERPAQRNLTPVFPAKQVNYTVKRVIGLWLRVPCGDRHHPAPRRRPLTGRSTASVPPGARPTFFQENTPHTPSRLEPLSSPTRNTHHIVRTAIQGLE